MRILIFLDADHLSGPARLALDFSVEAARLGHEILMLGIVRAARPHPTEFSRAMDEAGIPTRLLHERFRFDPGVIRQFRALLATFRPDVFQSHGYKGSVLGLDARRRGVRWQAFFHGFTWENWRVRLYHALDVRLMRKSDEVVTVSREFVRQLSQKGIAPARLRWIPNAISESNLRRTDSGTDLRAQWFGPGADASVVAGVIGRLSPEKNPLLFLEAFDRAAAAHPHLRAVVVGDGPLMEPCRARVARSPVRDRLVLAGFRSDLCSIYQALDLLVIPSNSEGMPTVLLEAMLMGVPVISTRVGAVPDIVRDGEAALLVSIGDRDALADALARLASDGDLRRRLAAAARRISDERLTVEGRTRTILAHAEALLAGGPIPENPWEHSD